MIKCVIAILVVATASFVINSSLVDAVGPTRIGVPSLSVSYFPAILAWKKGFFAQELTPDVPLERIFDFSVVEEINREPAK
jgi:ABC-type nitrate/sulfonate/bicarbonate transport system substrate-binding protein